MILVTKLAALFLLALTLQPSFDSGLAALAQDKQEKSLRDQIDAAVQGLRLKSAKVGVLVYSVRANQAVYGQAERDPLILASNTKLLTTSAALCRLGADFRTGTRRGSRSCKRRHLGPNHLIGWNPGCPCPRRRHSCF